MVRVATHGLKGATSLRVMVSHGGFQDITWISHGYRMVYSNPQEDAKKSFQDTMVSKYAKKAWPALRRSPL